MTTNTPGETRGIWTRAYMALAVSAMFLSLRAADVTTISGKQFRNVELMAVESDHVLLRHDGGRERVAWSDLTPSSQLEFLRGKVLELDRLKGELSKTRDETKALQKTTEQYRQNLAALGETLPEKPVTPAASLPPIAKGDKVDASEMAMHFIQDPATAEARYRKKTFRVEGVVERLEKDLFFSTYRALLRVPGKSVRVVCVIKPPEVYTKVYAARSGERMVAEGERLGKVTLMQAGDKLVFEGRCSGLSDGAVTFAVSQIIQ